MAKASEAAVTAEAALEESIKAARREGHSWRAIADATGISYQTLHRRHRRTVAQEQKG